MTTQIATIKSNINLLESKFSELGVQRETFLKEASFAVQAIAKNTYLGNCKKGTIEASVYNLALTGLTLNPAYDFAYLVPRKLNKKDKEPVCVLDISYRGLIKIATDSGGIKKVRAISVYENDFLDFEEGTIPYIRHRPALDNRGSFIAAYCVATLSDDSTIQLIMSKADIEKVRKTSMMADSGPWKNWYEEMALKTVIKRARKLWPHSPQLAVAVDVLNQHEGLAELANNNTPQLKPDVGIPMALPTETLDMPEEGIIPEVGEIVEAEALPGEVKDFKADPWDFGTADVESRITKKLKMFIEATLLKAGIDKDQFFKDFKLKNSLGGMADLRNKHLLEVKGYIENA